MFRATIFLLSGMYLLPVIGNPLDDTFKCHADDQSTALAVRIDQGSSLVYRNAIGHSDLFKSMKSQPDHPFQIGSITKQFTAAAILKLAEQNKLSLNDEIGSHISLVSEHLKHITIKQLLSHTSGLSDYFTEHVMSQWHDEISVDDLVKVINTLPLHTEQGGEQYNYSNAGYILLGKIIENTSKSSYSDFINEHIFQPLNMYDSFVMTKGTQLPNTKGYTNTPNLKPIITNRVVDRSWIYSSGAIVSTVDDLSKWFKGLQSSKIISPNSYKAMMNKVSLNNGQHIKYGYGIDIYQIAGLNSFSHSGMVPGFQSFIIYLPKYDIIASSLSNNDTVNPGPALLDMIALHLKLSPKKLLHSNKKPLMNKYIGKYQYSDGKGFEITLSGSNLVLVDEKQVINNITLREDNSLSINCSESYFQLRKIDSNIALVPISLYHGEQATAFKL